MLKSKWNASMLWNNVTVSIIQRKQQQKEMQNPNDKTNRFKQKSDAICLSTFNNQ